MEQRQKIKEVFRLARHVQKQLDRGTNTALHACREYDQLKRDLEFLDIMRNKLYKCYARRLPLIGKVQAADMISMVAEFGRKAEQVSREMKHVHTLASPGIRDLYLELASTISELQATYDLKEKTISVVTEPISFKGVEFGQFRIVLNLSEMSSTHSDDAYLIEALEPNYSSPRDDVSHPHVAGRTLCEGEASAAIHEALKTGRILDFFQLVLAVLYTYNPTGAYVQVENWSGVSCADCGEIMDPDDSCYCEACDSEVCGSCIYECRDCRTYVCGNCSMSCRCCGLRVCNECVQNCSSCGRRVCSKCLTECTECGAHGCQMCIEDRVCTTCKDQNESEEQVEKEVEIESTANAAV